MLRQAIVPLIVLGLAAGCSSSSGKALDARPAGDVSAQTSGKTDAAANLDGPAPALDVAPTPDDVPTSKADGPNPNKDAPLSPNDLPTAAVDSSTATDGTDAPQGDAGKDAPSRDSASPEARAEADTNTQAVCTPGLDVSCNHNPASAAIAGTCQADGTCSCKAGYAIVPSSGRCLALPVGDGGASLADADLACAAPYLSCVCQCCSDAPRNVACYYPTAGETLQAIKDKEAADRSVTNCAGAGCSGGTRYVCCTPAAPEPTSAATYVASGWSGGMNHLTINKLATECARLELAQPQTSRAGFTIESNNRWGVAMARFGACSDAAAYESVKGALGTLNLHRGSVANSCVVDVHVTLFNLTDSGEIKTARMDADDLAIDGMGIPCP